MSAGSALLARRVLGNPWGAVEQPSINRKCLQRAESTTTNIATSTQIKASVDSSVPIGGAKELPSGINPQGESESEPESEPHGRDHSAVIDHSMGSGRRCVGFLLGSWLSPPLAPANSKNKTLVSCTTRRDRWVRPIRISQVSTLPRAPNCREALALKC
jgi:hypothetical protein